MTQYKATFKCAVKDKFDDRYTALFYEYKGHEYQIIKANNWMACSSDYLYGDMRLTEQHKRAQAAIDEMIEAEKNPKPIEKGTFDMDEIWKLCGFD